MNDRNETRPSESAPRPAELTSIIGQLPTGRFRSPEEKLTLDGRSEPRHGVPVAAVRRPDFEQTLRLRALKQQAPPKAARGGGLPRERIVQAAGLLLVAGALLAAVVVVLL